MSKPYVIFVGDLREHLHPIQGTPDKETAITEAERWQRAYKFVEAVYMPEDDNSTSEVIYSNFER